MSWVRLIKTVCPHNSIHPCDVPASNTVEENGTVLYLDRIVNWRPGDCIVVTATDYIPSHSEARHIMGYRVQRG
jgi:hypothetical protein